MSNKINVFEELGKYFNPHNEKATIATDEQPELTPMQKSERNLLEAFNASKIAEVGSIKKENNGRAVYKIESYECPFRFGYISLIPDIYGNSPITFSFRIGEWIIYQSTSANVLIANIEEMVSRNFSYPF